MKKAAFHTLGCKVNSYETEAMQQLLEEAGYQIVPFSEWADVYVVNTCSLTNVADRKSRQMLHRARKLNPRAVVVAAGCYVQTAGEQLRLDAGVDLLIGNNAKTDLAVCLEAYDSEHKTEAIIDIGDASEYEELRISRTAGHTRAFIKIQDGCNQFCSYCIIPFARGRVRSRRADAVLAEVNRLVRSGCREVVLTGIHLSSYGADTGGQETLLNLIRQIHEIEGLERIRLGSLEPRIITMEFAEALAVLDKVCPHFHLSLQSGCNETLKRMNRHYTAEDFALRCNYLRDVFPNPALTTDVIVGFPGETRREFEQTKVFLEQLSFYEMHVFKYSKRKGTKAAVMDGQIAEQVKEERSEILLGLEKQMSRFYREQFLGSETQLLLETPIVMDGVEYLAGYTKEYIRAAVPRRCHEPNQLVQGRITDFISDELMAMKI